ncbi:MAG: Rieske 2Fe-2S domain-containing protein [Armatimonadota bacterium]|nr:Rieske 2Fe-2S domain-containing protein [Armatimonadota bacterium]
MVEQNEKTQPEVIDESRRRFLSFAASLISAIVMSLMAIPLVGMFLGPLFMRRKELWIDLGGISSVRPDQPTKFTYSYVKIDGWFEKTVYGSAYVVSDATQPVVLSNICTHLGCGVRWDQSRNAFLCPCHTGVFDRNGNVVSGPPPRPLPVFQSRVSNGKIQIKIKEV